MNIKEFLLPKEKPSIPRTLVILIGLGVVLLVLLILMVLYVVFKVLGWGLLFVPPVLYTLYIIGYPINRFLDKHL